MLIQRLLHVLMIMGWLLGLRVEYWLFGLTWVNFEPKLLLFSSHVVHVDSWPHLLLYGCILYSEGHHTSVKFLSYEADPPKMLFGTITEL